MNFFGLFTKFLNTLTSVYKIIKETLIAEFEKLMAYKITIVEAAKQPKVIILFFFFIIIYLSLLPIYVFIYIFCFFYWVTSLILYVLNYSNELKPQIKNLKFKYVIFLVVYIEILIKPYIISFGTMYNILLNIQVKRNITIYDKIVLITRFLINKVIRFVCGVPKSIIYKAFMSAYKLRFLKINNFSNEIYSQLLSVLWEDILDITYQRIYKTKEKKFNFNPDGFAAKILNQYRMFSAKDKKSIAHFLFANTENQAYFKHLLNSSITKEIKLDSLDKTHTSAFISLGTKGLMSNQTSILQNILVDKIKNIRLSVSTSYKYINDYKPRGVTENYIVTINEIEEKKVEYSYEDSRLFVKKSELLAVFNILNFVLSDRKEILIVHKGIWTPIKIKDDDTMLSILELIKDDIVLEAGAEKKIVEKTCDILDSLKRYTIENFYKLTAEEQLLITFATLDFYTNFSLTKQVDELYLNYIKEPSKKTEKQEDYEIDLYKALLEGKLFQAIAANEIKKGSLFDKVIIPIKNTPDEDL